MKNRIEGAAREYGTHKKDCTCKGNHFVEDKYKGFIAGAEFMQKEVERLNVIVDILLGCAAQDRLEIEKLKAQNEVMRETLEYCSNKTSDSLVEEIVDEALKKIGEV